MKNKIFTTLLTLIILTANAGYCSARSAVVQNIAIKFGLAMVGVVVSSIMIYLILAIYNKIISKNNNLLSENEEILKTPKTVDEAIKFFIYKNRLK